MSSKHANMNGIIRFLLSGLAVLLTAYLLEPHVTIKHYGYALLVALVLGFINSIVKPILVILTIPITVITFGLFMLVINALMIQLASWLVPGFEVENFWWALLFSVILSLFESMLFWIAGERKQKRY